MRTFQGRYPVGHGAGIDLGCFGEQSFHGHPAPAAEIAETYAREQRAEFDPQLEAVMSRNKGKSQRFLGSRPEPFELTSERLVYSAALNQALPTEQLCPQKRR